MVVILVLVVVFIFVVVVVLVLVVVLIFLVVVVVLVLVVVFILVVVVILVLVVVFILVVVVIFVLVVVFIFLVVVVILVLVVVFIFLVVVVLVFLVTVVSVELLREGHTVGAVVELGFYAEEKLVPVPAQAAAAVSEFRARIVDLALFRRPVVMGSNTSATAPDHPFADSVLQTGAAAAQRVGGAGRTGHESAKPLVGMTVSFVVAADGVDCAAHGIAAVEQGRRPLDDFQPLQLRRIDHLSVVARLGRKRTRSDAVFHDQHPVPVKTPHDGPGGTRSEAALGNPGADSVVQHLPQ